MRPDPKDGAGNLAETLSACAIWWGVVPLPPRQKAIKDFPSCQRCKLLNVIWCFQKSGKPNRSIEQWRCNAVERNPYRHSLGVGTFGGSGLRGRVEIELKAKIRPLHNRFDDRSHDWQIDRRIR